MEGPLLGDKARKVKLEPDLWEPWVPRKDSEALLGSSGIPIDESLLSMDAHSDCLSVSRFPGSSASI